MEILSLGAGVQSTTMALMACKGEISPALDCMIFADTGWEPAEVYEHLAWLEGEVKRLTNDRVPVYRVTAGNIREDSLKSVDGSEFNMPTFAAGGNGMARRQCTRKYKIDPIRRKVRELLGLKKGARVPKGVTISQWIGISTDEALRMKPSWDKWTINRWPLIEADMSRQNCLQWFDKNYPGRTLAKSACIGCPYHNDVLWRDMKINDPVSFADAVDFDANIRKDGAKLGGMRLQQYLHKSCKPLDEVDFRNAEDMGQLNMFNNECEGMCGV